MTIIYQPFVQNLNESTAAMIARLSTFLGALGPIGLQDVVLTKRVLFNNIRWDFTLQYTSAGPADFGAVYFSSLAGVSVGAQAAAFFALNPLYRVAFVLDVSQEIRRKIDHDAICCIYTTTLIPNCGQDRSRPIIVEALGNILAGATGNVQMVAASGLLSSVVSVTNRAGFTWAIGTRGYAAARPGTCVWDGYPTCC